MVFSAIIFVGAVWAASVERYQMVIPVSPDGADGKNDSTYAAMAGAENCIDLFTSRISFLRYSVGFTKSTHIDTLHVITRTSMDKINWTVIDSQKLVASGIKTHTFSVADTGAVNLQRYYQTYVKLAAVDNTDQIIPQQVEAYYIGLDGNKNWIGWYGRAIQCTLTE